MPQAAKSFDPAAYGFDPKAYVAKNNPEADSGFDPKGYVESAAMEGRKKSSPIESTASGALRGLTLGYAPQIQGALQTVSDARTGKISSLEDAVKSYRQNRDLAIAKSEVSKNDNPGYYTAGEIGGGLATTAMLPVGKAAEGASKLYAFIRPLMVGGATGAVIGGGNSSADLTKGEFEQFGGDVAQGAALGGTLEGLQTAAGGAVRGAINRFKNIPEERAVKAVTGQNISALRQISGTTLKSAGDIGDATKRITKVGRDILDEPGVLTPFSKVEDIGPKLAESRQKYGALIGDVAKKIDELQPNAVDAKSVANQIMDFASQIPATEAGKKLQNRLGEEAANFEKIGALSFQDAQKFKNQFKYKAVDADALISNQDATNAVRNIISKEMDKTAANLAQNGSDDVKDLLSNYGAYKSKYGSFKAASDAATDRIQKNQTNRWPSPSDYGVGSAIGIGDMISHGGLNLGSVAVGAGAAMANKFARERGSALAAKTADGIIKAFNSGGVKAFRELVNPVIEAAKQGDPAAVSTLLILQQSDPRAMDALKQDQTSAMKRRLGVE